MALPNLGRSVDGTAPLSVERPVSAIRKSAMFVRISRGMNMVSLLLIILVPLQRGPLRWIVSPQLTVTLGIVVRIVPIVLMVKWVWCLVSLLHLLAWRPKTVEEKSLYTWLLRIRITLKFVRPVSIVVPLKFVTTRRTPPRDTPATQGFMVLPTCLCSRLGATPPTSTFGTYPTTDTTLALARRSRV